MTTTIDRSADITQPLEKLGPDETLKFNSDYLRGKISFDLLDRITGGVTFESNKLMKFHGIYQQDDRDIRDERRRQKLEPALTFMVRVRLPGGVCTPEQWLKVDELAQAHGGNTIRLTTRQTFQFHWIVKEDIKPTIQGLHDVLLDTIAACGDEKAMARDVHEALLQIIQREGGLTRDGAEEYVRVLSSEHRYQRDVY